MKKSSFLVLVLAAVFTTSAFADKSTKIMRGGLGFLFPDHNSFANPGQFPLSYGMAIETGYTRVNGSSAQGLTPSFVYGNGQVGLGAYYTRSGMDLGSSASSSIGAGVGASFLKDKFTMGAGYSRSLDSTRTNDGTIQVTANLNGPQRKGPSVGVGFGTTLGAATNVRTGTASVGYSFRSNDNIEAGVLFNNLSSFSDFDPYFAGTVGSQYMYLGGTYRYLKTAEQHQAGARIGFILGRYIDLSASASYVLVSGGASSYGATVRASF